MLFRHRFSWAKMESAIAGFHLATACTTKPEAKKSSPAPPSSATTEVNGHSTLELQRNVIRRVNVGDIVTRSAARAPGDPAVVDGDHRTSYGQLNAAVNRLANALSARRYRRGDALALVSGNGLE